MFKPVSISPSILSANFLDLGADVALIERAGAAYVHVDVMDGHFVPNLTMGLPLIKQLKRATDMPLDVHLMISNPLEQLPWFLEAGCDMISVHAEALDEAGLVRAVSIIQGAGAKASVALKPKTPVEQIACVLSQLDMALVMSVEPGFSGQSYIAGSEAKVAEIAIRAASENPDMLIEVDGGIGLDTVGLVCAAGADVVVCGNAVFAAEDPAQAIAQITEAAESARSQALSSDESYAGVAMHAIRAAQARA